MAGTKPTGDFARMVDREIIPRLMLSHAPAPQSDRAVLELDAPTESAISADDMEAFARTVLSRFPEAMRAFIDGLMQSGISIQTVYCDLLAPAARLLGELWDQDRLSYTEVTIGLGRLQQLVHSLDWQSPYNGEGDNDSRSVLFAPRPGEQPTFGFYIIEEMFRWSGWRAWIETCSTNAQMVSNVQFRWFDMFCLSVCRDTNIEEVSTTIRAIRRASRNQDMFVLIYGRAFLERPELVATVGADGAASCAGEAFDMADEAVWHAATG